MDPLAAFSAPTGAWFAAAFPEPTEVQAAAWPVIRAGHDVLAIAPTGSGKTLAAFLWAIDRCLVPRAERGVRVLYVSPLKALAVDVERNLRAPLAGIAAQAARMGLPEPRVSVGVRTGDTPSAVRAALVRRPPDVLITTPESLFLVLTSLARSTLADVETVIIDEVHAIAGSKRGAHLAVSLARLDHLAGRRVPRVGLSATVSPPEEAARFLGGDAPVQIVRAGAPKEWDLGIQVPVEDMADLAASTGPGATPSASIWPHVEARIVDLIEAHRSTIVFANSRRLAERITARVNELHAEREVQRCAEVTDPASPVLGPLATGAREPGTPGAEHTGARRTPAELMAQAGASSGAPPVLARSHHGSVSREQRALIEDDLKTGRLRAVIATSSLELGIDMGAVDLVIQVEAPPSVSSGLQRVGRAGHQVGAVSEGVVLPKHRADLLAATVVVDRMRTGLLESLSVPSNPLDVAAQQVVACVAMEDWPVADLLAMLRTTAPFRDLTPGVFGSVIEMLAGRYPSDAFAELRPRLVWDREADVLHARPGAQRLAVTSGGTIPDRGLFAVVTEGGGRVGELDEEMVYESRVGDVVALGASSWRVTEITHDRVHVVPAPGAPGRLPFWRGDQLGRPAELGRAIGEFTRHVAARRPDQVRAWLADLGLDPRAAENLLGYVTEQAGSGSHVPTDRTIVVERSRDELGDWRLTVLSPFGARVHAPWALLARERLAEHFGMDTDVMHGDDGIVARLPDLDGDDWVAQATACLFPDPDEIEAGVTRLIGSSALFAARFRECAARALLLPRLRPGRRAPLWQQRQRSAQLLAIAAEHADFPIVLEAVRECLQDVYDLPALVDLMTAIAARRVRVVETDPLAPSPFARSLLFGYVAAFLYEGDTPLAERRAAALTLDPALLGELLGQADLRDLLEPDAITQVVAQVQRLTPERAARSAEEVTDLLRALGPLTLAEVVERTNRGRVAEPEVPVRRTDADAGEPGEPEEPDDPDGLAHLDAGDRHVRSLTVDPSTVESWLDDLAATRRVFRTRITGRTVWAVVEDAARLRDGLGSPLPPGLPSAHLARVSDPIGDLIARYARTHGPFTAADVASALGLPLVVITDRVAQSRGAGRLVEGQFLATAAGTQLCHPDVLRLIKRRSVALLRHQIEPVSQQSLGVFLPRWHGIGPRGMTQLRGAEGVLAAIHALAGLPVPVSTLETTILPARVTDYTPAMLDELTANGEVRWTGSASLPGGDAWIILAPSACLLGRAQEPPRSALATELLAVLTGGGGWFAEDLAARVSGESVSDESGGQSSPEVPVLPHDHLARVSDALLELLWAGLVSNDTLDPVRTTRDRAQAARGRTAARASARVGRARPPRGRYADLWRGPRKDVAVPGLRAPLPGRWFVLPAPDLNPGAAAISLAEAQLDRLGLVTRAAVAASGDPGGFAAARRTLTAMEDRGRVQRVYAVEGLGAAQFALPGVVDQLREIERELSEADSMHRVGPDDSDGGRSGVGAGIADPGAVRSAAGDAPRAAAAVSVARGLETLVLAAADPANAYGAALDWPASDWARGVGAPHRPGRAAGSVVVLRAGRPILYVERGGRSALTFGGDPARTDLVEAACALLDAVRSGRVPPMSVTRINGLPALEQHPATAPLANALVAAGFVTTSRGYRARG